MYNPERVELVRQRLELTKTAFAEKLGVDRKTIQRFENGTHNLPQAAIKSLCEFSDYPEEFFFKLSPDIPNADAVSFRSLRSLTAKKRDAALAVSSLAFEFDDWINERYNLPESRVVVTEQMSPQEAAMYIRVQWGIGNRPIGNMINLLEAHGVRVFSLSEETRHLDAYSFWRNEKPYVFLNTLKTCERSRFDAAHELGHLVMHRHSGSAHTSAEREADAFASMFLMPTEDVLASIGRVHSLRDLVVAKKRWGVSVAALAYKLHKMEKITDWHYRGYCIELGKMGRNVEPDPMEREVSLIWKKVLQDLWNQRIPISKIAQLLYLPERELNDVLFGIASEVKI